MTTQKVIRPIALFLALFSIAWAVASCATAPKATSAPVTPEPAKPTPPTEVPTPAPTPEPAPTPVPAPTSKNPLTAAEFQAAEQAIAEAEATGAATYASELLNQAKQALADAHAKAEGDPDAARISLQTAIDKAHAARDTAKAALLAVLKKLDQDAQAAIAEAEAVEADKYAPAPLGEARKALAQGRDQTATSPLAAQASYQRSIEQAHAARDAASVARTQALLGLVDAALGRWNALNPGQWDADENKTLVDQGQAAKAAVRADYAAGQPQATAAIAALDDATAKLGARLKAVQDLRGQAQAALDAADAAEAPVWVPDLVQSANDAFFEGTGAWKKYRLDAAEEAWSTALFQAKSAAAKAQAEKDRRQTELLMMETMKKLEDASGKTVVDPQDHVIPPQPWDGQKELQQLQTPTKPVSVLIPADGSVVVLGDVQRVTYLDEAKAQWVQGVKALNAGDLTLANQSFLQSQKLIETYLAMAVDKVYTVRLIPDHRDSLWRISEYGDIYATPWDWPKIWKRNQKLIQNPDLIYPGWQLIIPPQ